MKLVVLNGGEARFTEGYPITMGINNIAAVHEVTDRTVVVYIQAVNHCPLSRDDLQAATEDVLVPEDGERVFLEGA